MKITNRMGLPEPIVKAVENDGYSRGNSDISVTSLLKPPRVTALEHDHADEITEDASDRIWSLLGQSVHAILERANQTGVAERRLAIEVEGWRVSGGMDLVCKDKILSDYKTTTAWKFKNGQVPIEYEQQLNCYAEILRANGEDVLGLQIVAILRDWSKLEARRDAGYPQSQVIVLPVQMWSSEAAKEFLRARVLIHQAARKELPECSPDERWAKPDTFALMKRGNKKATKVYDNEKDADSHASTNEKLLYVQKRPGESTRCEAYCSVAKWCQQFKATKKPVVEADEFESEAV